jgi:uncharacterized coiled-coil protein SlyX
MEDKQIIRKKASPELVLAAHLNQAREQIIALRKQVAEQEQIIAQLQNQVAFFEIQAVNKENEKLRLEHGLKLGQQIVQDNGEWWVIETLSPSPKVDEQR